MDQQRADALVRQQKAPLVDALVAWTTTSVFNPPAPKDNLTF
ncbi:hypothetical protein MVEN_00128800 [Mycena venus]|uniref:Uncharacterized protein n=1 Tax=Mycena venus TaxID=2733690 RepID=A0A8H7DGV0_9AGAR|nr:hypothetical protein MVEN_00128800 [Mycena venus]